MKKIKVTVITGGVGGLTWAKSFVKLYDTGRIGRSLNFGYDAVFSIAPYTYQCTIGNWVDDREQEILLQDTPELLTFDIQNSISDKELEFIFRSKK